LRSDADRLQEHGRRLRPGWEELVQVRGMPDRRRPLGMGPQAVPRRLLALLGLRMLLRDPQWLPRRPPRDAPSGVLREQLRPEGRGKHRLLPGDASGEASLCRGVCEAPDVSGSCQVAGSPLRPPLRREALGRIRLRGFPDPSRPCHRSEERGGATRRGGAALFRSQSETACPSSSPPGLRSTPARADRQGTSRARSDPHGHSRNSCTSNGPSRPS